MRLTTRLLGLCFVLLLAAGQLWPVPVRIIATGDMHGWMLAQPADGQQLGGAAEMLAYWQKVENYQPKDFLLISCGDNVTGPALATIFKGEPVINVMNLMGYDLSVVGNHEFDNGLAGMQHFRAWAKFPFLAANLVKADGTPTDLAVPTLLYEEQGVKVGIIGLTVEQITQYANTGGQTGQAYAPVVKKLVPELKAKGAQVIIVAAHAPLADMSKLAKDVAELGIPLIFGAHSHEYAQAKVGNTWVINNGQWWQGYTRVDLDYNPNTGKTAVLACKQVTLQQEKPERDPAVAAEIDRWQRQLDTEYGTALGYLQTALRRPGGVSNFITDCWLAADPASDVAMGNLGGFRQDIPAGAITKLLVIGIMPFDNKLLRVTLTGEQLLGFKPPEAMGMAGLRKADGGWVLAATGKPLDPQATYHLLINDFIYNKSPYLQGIDPQPAVAAQDWRQPLYDWLAKHPSSQEKPLTITDVELRPWP